MLWVRTKASENNSHFLNREHLTRGRPAKIGNSRLGEQPNPNLPDRLGRKKLRFAFRALVLGFGEPPTPRCSDRLVAREIPGTINSKMDPQPQAVLELQKHLLANSPSRHHPLATDQGRTGSKTSLWG